MKSSPAIDNLPEPYRKMLYSIQPRDLYILRELPATGEVVDIHRIQAEDSAEHLATAQQMLNNNAHLRTRTLTGRSLRSLIVALAGVEGVSLTTPWASNILDDE